MKKVIIPTALDSIAKETLEKHGGYAVIQLPKCDLPQVLRDNPDTHALIVRSEKITAEMIDSCPGLKVIVRAGAGYNTIDIRHARKHGIDVMNTPGANSNAVAEEVVALLLADARHLIPADASTRAGKWEKSSFMGHELAGKTIGIVGLGYIGRLVARRLSGFDVRLIGYDPFLSADKAQSIGVTLTTLPELFATADAVTLHIPENDDTRGLIGAALLSSMKPGATLVNCARAGILDEAALRAAKAANPTLRFLNDVYAKDAEGPKSVADIADIMLPHLGASTREANHKAAELAARELIDRDDKGITAAVVNRDIPAGLDPAYARLANIVARLCRVLLGHATSPRLVEARIYGELKPFSDWLLTPVAAALAPDYDTSLDRRHTLAFLAEKGIDYLDRPTDEAKKYTSSFTLDITGNTDPRTLARASVRGTVEEGNLLISRINDFDKLYIEPAGNFIAFTYDDRTGVLGRIAAAVAEAGLNIEDVRNPLNPADNTSLALLKISAPASDELVARIADLIHAKHALHIEF
jgi:D-3-phosphoglycerate dehydrogenase